MSNGVAVKVEREFGIDMIEVRFRNVVAHGQRNPATGEIKSWQLCVGRRWTGRVSAGEARAAIGLRGPAISKILLAIEAGRI